MPGFRPSAHFRFPKCASWLDGLVGRISDNRNIRSHARRFGSRKRDHFVMRTVTTVAEMRRQARTNRRVLVPTMGALHRAHEELIRIARDHAGTDGEVAVSIFVNPLQFEPGSDYERYPRPEKEDEALCRRAGVDLLFRPSESEMYAADRSVYVEENQLSTVLEGKTRPGHFRGVGTVVAKLFSIVEPDAAMFGEKDFQQLAIIRRMVRDLNFPIEIVGVPIVREPDGPACSSRNRYPNPEETKKATVLDRKSGG